MPPDGAVRLNATELEVRWIVEGWHAARERTTRGSVVRGRWRVAERFMGPALVELAPPALETRLLARAGGTRRARRFGFERAMHPLMHPVLLRRTALDPLRANAEVQPPDRERRQAAERVRGREGNAVIGANDARQPVVGEAALKAARDRGGAHALEREPAEHAARV